MAGMMENLLSMASQANPQMQGAQGAGVAGAMGMAQELLQNPEQMAEHLVKMAGVPFMPRSPWEWASLWFLSNKIPMLGYWRSRSAEIDGVVGSLVDAPKQSINKHLAQGANHVLGQVLKIKNAPNVDAQKIEKVLSGFATASLIDNAVDMVTGFISNARGDRNMQTLVSMAGQMGVDLTDPEALHAFMDKRMRSGGLIGGILRFALPAISIGAGIFSAFNKEITEASPALAPLASAAERIAQGLSIGKMNERIAQQLYYDHLESPDTLQATLSDPSKRITLEQLLETKQMVETFKVDDREAQRKLAPPSFASESLSPLQQRREGGVIQAQNQRAAAWEILSAIEGFRGMEKQLADAGYPQQGIGEFQMELEEAIMGWIHRMAAGHPFPQNIAQVNQTLDIVKSQLGEAGQQIFEAVVHDIATQGRTLDYLGARAGEEEVLARKLHKKNVAVGVHSTDDGAVYSFHPALGATETAIVLPEGVTAWKAGEVQRAPVPDHRTAFETPIVTQQPAVVAGVDPKLAMLANAFQVMAQNPNAVPDEAKQFLFAQLMQQSAPDTKVSAHVGSEGIRVADQVSAETAGEESIAIVDAIAVNGGQEANFGQQVPVEASKI